MSKIKGKQIESNSITNEQIYITTPPALDTDAVNKGYLIDYVNSAATSGSTTIGTPRDGSWDVNKSDGLLPFVSSDKVGWALDDINEVLKALAPPPAPNLQVYNADKVGTESYGYLSFGSSFTIPGYTNHPTINIDQLYSSSTANLGISASGNISGTLNSGIPADGGTPNPAYPANAFSDADKGEIRLYINNQIQNSINLTNTAATDTTSLNAGFNISAAQNVLFPGGNPLNLFKYRTGTYLIKMTCTAITYGYNNFYVEHYVSATDIRTLSSFNWINDGVAQVPIVANGSLGTLVMGGSKYLSGIRYHTSGSTTYTCGTIQHAFSNTYPQTGGISFTPTNCSISNLNISDYDSGDSGATITTLNNLPVTLTPRRVFNGSISVLTTVTKTLSRSGANTATSISGLLMDNDVTNSTDLLESFQVENRRMTPATYDLYSSISNDWNSTISIKDGGASYNDGLQFYNRTLVRPTLDFSATTCTNGYTTNQNYSTGMGSSNRTFYRYFRQASPSTANFTLTLAGTSTTFVSVGTSLTTNNAHIEMKLPGASASETGWMDCTAAFSTNTWNDGAGCRNGAGSVNLSGTTPLTVGTKSTSNSNGYVVFRITTGPAWSGTITNMQLQYS
jgi:hypothetical protein